MEVKEKNVAEVKTADEIINVNGSSHEKRGDINQDNVKIYVTGSSTLDIKSINCTNAEIHVSVSSTINIGILNCQNVQIFASSASTLRILTKLDGTEKTTIRCVGASFVHIESLGGKNLDINHSYSSSMYIGNVACQDSHIDVSFSSRLDIIDGKLDKMSGAVNYTSFVRNKAIFPQPGDLGVTVDGSNKAPHTNLFGSTYTNT